jgi:membrane-associated PAP2 superfamily phosphatase
MLPGMLFPRHSKARLARVTLVLLAGLIAWDASGLDLALARLSGGPQGFPLRDTWLLTSVMHDGVRYAGWLLTVALCAGVAWPVGPLARMNFPRRVQWPATAMLAALAISVLKALSGTSCPWDLSEFGGTARHFSHWLGWMASDGGSGRCFPGGHASTGFAFIGGYFAMRPGNPRLARACLGAAIAAGLLFGVTQQLRGADFMSHTLWTGWVCWTVAWLADPWFQGTPAVASPTGPAVR